MFGKFFSIELQIANCSPDNRKNDLVEQDGTTDPIVASQEGKGGEEGLTGAARVWWIHQAICGLRHELASDDLGKYRRDASHAERVEKENLAGYIEHQSTLRNGHK